MHILYWNNFIHWLQSLYHYLVSNTILIWKKLRIERGWRVSCALSLCIAFLSVQSEKSPSYFSMRGRLNPLFMRFYLLFAGLIFNIVLMSPARLSTSYFEKPPFKETYQKSITLQNHSCSHLIHFPISWNLYNLSMYFLVPP